MSDNHNRAGMTTLAKFFKANCDEELTAKDAAAKLEISETAARTYLGRLAAQGLLERVSVYRVKQ